MSVPSAVKAMFRGISFSTKRKTLTTTEDSWNSDRIVRAARFWSMYNNAAYEDIEAYIATFGEDDQLYKYTRGLRSPVFRYVEFYASNVWGGDVLSPSAEASGALPIITKNELIRPALAKVWQWSNWASKRVLAVRYGAAIGDCFIKVPDNPASKKTFLQPVFPAEIKDIDWDDFGNVKMVRIERVQEDKTGATPMTYVYGELIEHPSVWGGRFTRVTTYRNGQPYAYGNFGPQWLVPYDFVPLVHCPHIDIGLGFGTTGFAATERKIAEADALASTIADQISKFLNAPKLLLGASADDLEIKNERGKVPVIAIPYADVKLEELVGKMPVAEALSVLESQMAEIRQDLPELSLRDAVKSGLSSDAIGRIYADVIANIELRRQDYDAALVRAQMMALAIGGIRGYGPEFESFSLSSYAQGKLDHSIGKRQILPHSAMEKIQEDLAKWNVATLAKAVEGTSAALRDVMGYDEAKIGLALQSIEKDADILAKKVADPANTGMNDANAIAGITKDRPVARDQATVNPQK